MVLLILPKIVLRLVAAPGVIAPAAIEIGRAIASDDGLAGWRKLV